MTIAGWLLRLGFLALPPIVGALSDATSLQVALGALALFGVAVIGLAPRVGTRATERA